MRTSLRCVGLLAGALSFAAVGGACGGDDDSAQSVPAVDDNGEDSGGDRGDDGGGIPGVPAGGSGGGAPGAPIDIPAISDLQGLSVDEATEVMTSKIRDACGGDLCLVVEVENLLVGDCHSTYRGEPPAGTVVDRGSTFVLIAQCIPDGEGAPGTDPGTGGEGEPDTDTGTDPGTEGEGEPETGTDADAEADTGDEVEPEGAP